MFTNSRKLLVPLATMTVAGAVTVGSGATWTSESTSTSEVTSGILEQENGAHGATLDLSNLKPGDVMSGSLTITNTGTLDSKLAVVESDVANPFVVNNGASDLQMNIKRDGTTVYNGNFGNLGAGPTDVTGTDPLLAVDDAVTTGDDETSSTFTFTVTLKSNADPLSQGLEAGARYTFVATPVDGESGLVGDWVPFGE